MTNQEITGDHLRSIRAALKLSQDDMAKLLGVAKSTISQVESINDSSKLSEYASKSAIVDTILKMEFILDGARKDNPDAIDAINAIYSGLEKNMKWLPAVGVIAAGGLLGGIVAGFASGLFNEKR